MKKEYQKPEIAIIEVETEQMLATSALNLSNESANPAFGGLSKEHDFDFENW